jgi:chromate reductase, NAD(P)H dehydrogenase (quinone)
MEKKARVLLINASLAGDGGNTGVALKRLAALLTRRADVRTVRPAKNSFAEVESELASADAFLFGTGTHWDSWSSMLQKFLEDATETEGTKLWLGKPAACVVTEHSVGGKGVLSRLQGVLVTLGCSLPPMSGLVLSKVSQMAARDGAKEAEDFWCLDDLKIVAHNLVEAVNGTRRWKAWPVDRTDFSARWMK